MYFCINSYNFISGGSSLDNLEGPNWKKKIDRYNLNYCCCEFSFRDLCVYECVCEYLWIYVCVCARVCVCV
jgi:hypothetical protein